MEETLTVPRKLLEELYEKLGVFLKGELAPTGVLPAVEHAAPETAHLLAWRTSQDRHLLIGEIRELKFRYNVRRPIKVLFYASQPGLTDGQVKLTRRDRGVVPLQYNGPVLNFGTYLGKVALATVDEKVTTNYIRVFYGPSRKPPLDPKEARKFLK